MKGEYTGTYKRGQLAVFWVSMAILTAGLIMSQVMDHGIYGFIAIVTTIIAGLIGEIMFRLIPCSYTADENGFTISMLGRKHLYRYVEIEHIGCEYTDTDRYGNAYVKLTVECASGSVKSFTESVGVKMHEIMNDPRSEKPQLMRLCDFVNKKMGAAA